MTETHTTSKTIEQAVHDGFKESAKRLGYPEDMEPFYNIRTISPATNTVIIGRAPIPNQDIAALLKVCTKFKVMEDPALLYDQIMARTAVDRSVKLDTKGQLPNIWKKVFAGVVEEYSAEGTSLSNGQFRNGNLDTLGSRMEEFVKGGIGYAFDRVRLEVKVGDEDIEVRQRCPIKNFVKTRWLPAYIAVRERLAVESPELIPVEEVIQPTY